MLLNDSVKTIPFVGPRYAVLLERLGITTVKDLLYHFPSSYRDASQIVTISELNTTDAQTVSAVIAQLKNIRLRGGKSMQRAKISDESGVIEAVWFNQPFLVKALREGSQVLLSGKLNPKSPGHPQLASPKYELVHDVAEQVHLGRIVPVYALTEGLSDKWMRSRLFWLITHLHHVDDLEETLPEAIRQRYQLQDLRGALKGIHFPETKDQLIISRRKLAFDELMEIQKKLLLERQKRLTAKAPQINTDAKAIQDLIESIPFPLSASQKTACSEIHVDMQNPYPMKRLLQGDVGSGKTIVAVISAFPVIRSGLQVAVLAPTGVLAEQLYHNFRKYLAADISIELITSDRKTSSNDTPKIDVLIGTHALLHRKERLIHNLGLLVVDEEHRFGVNQRRELVNFEETSMPHTLYLTATPIPRSIALTLFGDMNVTTIDKPVGRIPPKTFLVTEDKRRDSYTWIEQQLATQGQAFWICPLIEENPESELKSVMATHKEVSKSFKDYRVGLLHGRMTAEEKNTILADFKQKKYSILVSTTVIEVGIDIPDANIIVIEGADRFGLAQLHQLRGRVGRNNQESWCLLFTTLGSRSEVHERLNFFSHETNGIKIAEYDLQMRGPGEVYGTVQSGIPLLKVANFSNVKLLEETLEAAKSLSAFN